MILGIYKDTKKNGETTTEVVLSNNYDNFCYTYEGDLDKKKLESDVKEDISKSIEYNEFAAIAFLKFQMERGYRLVKTNDLFVGNIENDIIRDKFTYPQKKYIRISRGQVKFIVNGVTISVIKRRITPDILDGIIKMGFEPKISVIPSGLFNFTSSVIHNKFFMEETDEYKMVFFGEEEFKKIEDAKDFDESINYDIFDNYNNYKKIVDNAYKYIQMIKNKSYYKYALKYGIIASYLELSDDNISVYLGKIKDIEISETEKYAISLSLSSAYLCRIDGEIFVALRPRHYFDYIKKNRIRNYTYSGKLKKAFYIKKKSKSIKDILITAIGIETSKYTYSPFIQLKEFKLPKNSIFIKDHYPHEYSGNAFILTYPYQDRLLYAKGGV